MRRIALGFALGVLLAAAPGGAALAAQPEASVLTPEQMGLTEPGQGFYPFFTGLGGSPFQQPATGFFGSGSLTGVGLTAVTSTGATVGTPGFLGFSGLAGTGGSFAISPFALGAAIPFGTGCGVFSVNFCPLFTSTPLQSSFGTSAFGLGGIGLGALGLGTLGTPGLSGQVIVIR